MTEEKKPEVTINLDGSIPEFVIPKVLIKEGEHKGQIESIELANTKKWKSEETEKKFIFNVKINDVEGTVPLFCSPIITKGSTSTTGKKYNDSKLFTILEDANLLDKVRERKEEISSLDGLQLFLSENLVGVAGRFGVETARKGQEGEYSVVKKVYEFVFDSVPVAAKEEK